MQGEWQMLNRSNNVKTSDENISTAFVTLFLRAATAFPDTFTLPVIPILKPIYWRLTPCKGIPHSILIPLSHLCNTAHSEHQRLLSSQSQVHSSPEQWQTVPSIWYPLLIYHLDWFLPYPEMRASVWDWCWQTWLHSQLATGAPACGSLQLLLSFLCKQVLDSELLAAERQRSKSESLCKIRLHAPHMASGRGEEEAMRGKILSLPQKGKRPIWRNNDLGLFTYFLLVKSHS